MIGTNGKRESGKSMLASQLDDYIYIWPINTSTEGIFDVYGNGLFNAKVSAVFSSYHIASSK